MEISDDVNYVLIEEKIAACVCDYRPNEGWKMRNNEAIMVKQKKMIVDATMTLDGIIVLMSLNSGHVKCFNWKKDA